MFLGKTTDGNSVVVKQSNVIIEKLSMTRRYECRLRDVHDDIDEHEFLVELHNDPLVLHNLTHPSPITMEQHIAWWKKKILDDPHELRLIFDVDGIRIGFTKFCFIDIINNNCELGADIHKDHRGKGYAIPMWKLMLDYCFNDVLLHRVFLSTAEYNNVARNLYKKLGFKQEGRLTHSLYRRGTYHDCIMMYMLKEDWDLQCQT